MAACILPIPRLILDAGDLDLVFPDLIPLGPLPSYLLPEPVPDVPGGGLSPAGSQPSGRDATGQGATHRVDPAAREVGLIFLRQGLAAGMVMRRGLGFGNWRDCEDCLDISNSGQKSVWGC